MRHFILWFAILIFSLPATSMALCGGPLNANAFKRPIDFNDPRDKARINLVERYHFTPEVAALIQGKSSPVPIDIAYTLRQIPNHYRALDAMARWQLKHTYREGVRFLPIDCYFQRAFSFKPNDPNLHLIHGVYLHKKKKYKEALKAYQTASSLGSRSPELHYNLGLLYVELKEYEKARTEAKKAYQLGYTLPALRNKLQKLGFWE